MNIKALLAPDRLWTRDECLGRDSPVPRVAGVYAWYFRELPSGVPSAGCLRSHGATLLYVGISPRRPPLNGAAQSRQTLRNRIRYHFRGNAEGSTLRLTLGCLLQSTLGLRLWRVGSGTRYTFADGERVLSKWMAAHGLVAWLPATEPWIIEEELIASVSLPLNLDQNSHHSFHAHLSALRREARAHAREAPIWRAD